MTDPSFIYDERDRIDTLLEQEEPTATDLYYLIKGAKATEGNLWAYQLIRKLQALGECEANDPSYDLYSALFDWIEETILITDKLYHALRDLVGEVDGPDGPPLTTGERIALAKAKAILKEARP